MSQRNVDVVRGLQPDGVDLVPLFAGEGAEAALNADAGSGVIRPDAEIAFVAGESGVEQRDLHGLPGLIEGWRDWLEGWDSYVLNVEDLLEAGERVVALVRIKGRTSRDGVELEHTPAAVWELEDGIVVGLTFYLDRAQAMQVAGLSG
jgi:SnoaL-like domain